MFYPIDNTSFPSKNILIITIHLMLSLRAQYFLHFCFHISSSSFSNADFLKKLSDTHTLPSLISPETLVHIPEGWWGYLNPDPRRQKTSQFGDYEEHNTQHSGFHISAQHSSLHCIHAGHTRRDKRLVRFQHGMCLAGLMTDTINLEILRMSHPQQIAAAPSNEP